MNNTNDTPRIGILTISDRASSGEYEDKGGPAIRNWISAPPSARHHSRRGKNPVRRARAAPRVATSGNALGGGIFCYTASMFAFRDDLYGRVTDSIRKSFVRTSL